MAFKEHTPGGPKSMGMTKAQLHDFAATPEKDLPEHADTGSMPGQSRFHRWVGHSNGGPQEIFPAGHTTGDTMHKFAKSTDYLDEGTAGVRMGNREFRDEHERLPDILRHGTPGERREEAREQEGELRDRFPSKRMDKGGWISRAVSSSGFKRGALTAQAKRVGESPMQFARQHQGDSGVTGRRARFAINANK